MEWSSPQRDTKPKGGEKATEVSFSLHSAAFELMQHDSAAQSWLWSLMKSLVGMFRLLLCSTGPKQHQERKEQKALVHHGANLESPGSWRLHAVSVRHAQSGGNWKCYKVKTAIPVHPTHQNVQDCAGCRGQQWMGDRMNSSPAVSHYTIDAGCYQKKRGL